MNDVPAAQLRARNLRTLAALAALFLLPVLAAAWMYYGTDWRPAGRVNHGELISPVRPLPDVQLPRVDVGASFSGAAAETGTPAAAGSTAPAAPIGPAGPVANADHRGSAPPQAPLFREKWSLVYVGGGSCGEACRQALYVMRQTRLALNNDMTRVARVFIVTGECCAREFLAKEHAGLSVVDASGEQGTALLRQFPAGDRAHSLFVVDPLGNLMMSYDARQNPRGLLEDLKKLLRLSHIG